MPSVDEGLPGQPSEIAGWALDASLAKAAADAYDGETFHIDGDVHVNVTVVDGIQVFAFRGTNPLDWQDWLRDISAWPWKAIDHPQLGLMHEGFASGAQDALPEIIKLLQTPYTITGHSLGGGEAIAAGALIVDSGNPLPIRLTTFGAPRVGYTLYKQLGMIPGRRFKNANDPVPLVPIWPYSTDRKWTFVRESGDNPIQDHSIYRYQAAILKQTQTATLLTDKSADTS